VTNYSTTTDDDLLVLDSFNDAVSAEYSVDWKMMPIPVAARSKA
jgi:hypothetical protein